MKKRKQNRPVYAYLRPTQSLQISQIDQSTNNLSTDKSMYNAIMAQMDNKHCKYIRKLDERKKNRYDDESVEIDERQKSSEGKSLAQYQSTNRFQQSFEDMVGASDQGDKKVRKQKQKAMQLFFPKNSNKCGFGVLNCENPVISNEIKKSRQQNTFIQNLNEYIKCLKNNQQKIDQKSRQQRRNRNIQIPISIRKLYFSHSSTHKQQQYKQPQLSPSNQTRNQYITELQYRVQSQIRQLLERISHLEWQLAKKNNQNCELQWYIRKLQTKIKLFQNTNTVINNNYRPSKTQQCQSYCMEDKVRQIMSDIMKQQTKRKTRANITYKQQQQMDKQDDKNEGTKYRVWSRNADKKQPYQYITKHNLNDASTEKKSNDHSLTYNMGNRSAASLNDRLSSFESPNHSFNSQMHRKVRKKNKIKNHKK